MATTKKTTKNPKLNNNQISIEELAAAKKPVKKLTDAERSEQAKLIKQEISKAKPAQKTSNSQKQKSAEVKKVNAVADPVLTAELKRLEAEENNGAKVKKSTVKPKEVKKPTTPKVATTKAKEVVAKPETTVAQTLPQEQSENNLETKNEVVNTEVKKKKKYKDPRILSEDEINPKLKKEKEKAKKQRKKKNFSLDDVERFNPDTKTGLTTEQVKKRTEEKLTNKVPKKNVKTYRAIFFSNIFTFFNLVCLSVAAALIAVGEWKKCMFLVIILANITIGIIQEIKAKHTVEKISLVTAPSATVLRDGVKHNISVSDVVLDDIIMFDSGKQICADCILLEGELEANESLLTGESVAVKKRKGDILYSGSFVASGKCIARVDRIGEFNYTSKLATKAKEYKKPKSELLRSLNIIIRSICVIVVPLATLMFFNNYSELNHDIPKTVTQTAGSIIGMIPAGMFLLTSVALAVGVLKLAKRRTLVQDLYSIEMLARADVLCLDKTGTITDGTMKVNSVIEINKTTHSINEIMGSVLTALEDNNQTSRALALHFGYSKEFTKDVVLPFSSSRKLSGVTFKNGETYAFGAPEFVLKQKDAEIESQVKEFASKGFRVILLVKCDGKIEGDRLPTKRTPIALITIEDHIRQDAPETIKWFKDNAVQIKIISGDNPITVSEVSKRVGVENAELFISLEGLNEQQVVEAAEKYTVFGRVSPEQKSILVKALKNKGHKVAMTGDGVNDILALKEADCSIAMASGSEATRNVSHLVLLDSNFSSMPSVVAEGRRVINNISKSSSLFLMKTLFTILISIFCLIIRREYPFNTNQILLLEYCVIGIPSFFLALQPNKEPIQGKFLSNLITQSLPGAIIFTLNVIVCYIFDMVVGTSGQFETMASLLVTFSGLLVLFKLCKPFDVYRACVYAGMILLCTLMLALIPWSFYEYQALSLQNALFMLCLVQFSYPLYANIVNLCNKIRFWNLN